MEKDIYTIRDLSKRWGCHYTTVMRLVNIGKIKSFRVGRHLKITAEALKEFEDSGGYGSYDPKSPFKRGVTVHVPPKDSRLVGQWRDGLGHAGVPLQ